MADSQTGLAPTESAPRSRSVWSRLRRRPAFWLSGSVIALFSLIAVAPALFVAISPATHDPNQCSLIDRAGGFQDLQPPSAEHWFGTDIEGCDYYARVVYGTRTSLLVGSVAVLAAGAIALLLGGIAGYYGGALDAVISRTTDVFFGIPFLVGAILLLTFVAGTQHSPLDVALVLGLLGWPLATRLFRSAVLQVRNAPFVDAARTIGASDWRVLTRHVVPTAVAPFLSFVALSVGGAVGAEAGLTFLGVGVSAPSISWGQMIDAAQSRLSDAAYLMLFPCVFLTLLVLAFLLLGEVLGDVLDPRGEGR